MENMEFRAYVECSAKTGNSIQEVSRQRSNAPQRKWDFWHTWSALLKLAMAYKRLVRRGQTLRRENGISGECGVLCQKWQQLR